MLPDGFKTDVVELVKELFVKRLRASRNNNEVEAFKRDRARLIRLIPTLFLRRQQTVLEVDPADWKGKLPYMLGGVGVPSSAAELAPPEEKDESPLAKFEREHYYGEKVAIP